MEGGDQGTRALVNNLNGGTFTNAEHTEYTWNPVGLRSVGRAWPLAMTSLGRGIPGTFSADWSAFTSRMRRSRSRWRNPVGT